MLHLLYVLEFVVGMRAFSSIGYSSWETVYEGVLGFGLGGTVIIFRAFTSLIFRQQYLPFSQRTSRISVTLQIFLQYPWTYSSQHFFGFCFVSVLRKKKKHIYLWGDTDFLFVGLRISGIYRAHFSTIPKRIFQQSGPQVFNWRTHTVALPRF